MHATLSRGRGTAGLSVGGEGKKRGNGPHGCDAEKCSSSAPDNTGEIALLRRYVQNKERWGRIVTLGRLSKERLPGRNDGSGTTRVIKAPKLLGMVELITSLYVVT